MSQTRRQKVEQAIQLIEQRHQIGLEIQRDRSRSEASDSERLRWVARRHGIQKESARKARGFANPYTGYTVKEKNDLCRLIRRIQPTQKDHCGVFGISFAERLLSLTKTAERTALQNEAIENGWTLSKFKSEIRNRYDTRGEGGRRCRAPSNAVDLLDQLRQMCDHWRRWWREVSPESDTVSKSATSFGTLEPKLRKEIVAISERLLRLQNAVERASGKLKPGRKRRQTIVDERQARPHAKKRDEGEGIFYGVDV
jgi:hypothetical protein